MMMTKAQLAERERLAYEQGYMQGISDVRSRDKIELNEQKLRALVQLMNAAGQAMNVNASIIQGLSSTLDNVASLK